MSYSKKQIAIVFISVLFVTYMLSSHIITDANSPVKEKPATVKVDLKEDLTSSSQGESLYVYLTGAIERPGLYEVAANTVMKDVIHSSGGFLPYAQTESVALEARVKESVHIHVPFNFQGNPEELVRKDVVSINSASEEELTKLPGIGPAMAKRIVEYRTKEGRFSTLEDLKKVKGIGDKLFQKLEGKVGL